MVRVVQVQEEDLGEEHAGWMLQVGPQLRPWDVRVPNRGQPNPVDVGGKRRSPRPLPPDLPGVYVAAYGHPEPVQVPQLSLGKCQLLRREVGLHH